MRYETARKILAEAIEQLEEKDLYGISESELDEGNLSNKIKKRNFLASRGTAMRPSAFKTPEDHRAALVASARDKMNPNRRAVSEAVMVPVPPPGSGIKPVPWYPSRDFADRHEPFGRGGRPNSLANRGSHWMRPDRSSVFRHPGYLFPRNNWILRPGGRPNSVANRKGANQPLPQRWIPTFMR